MELPVIKLSDIDFYHIGASIQIAGVIWSGDDKIFITTLPGKQEDYTNLSLMPLTLEEWEQVMRQTDLLEVEMFTQDPSGITKKLVRKSQRQIDTRMMWKCYQRDNYTCQYCGRDGVPLTVDHIILWEEGGPTITENLITACRTCNSDRGNMKYEDWIKSNSYKKRSENLPYAVKHRNEIEIIAKLPELEAKKLINKHSR